MNRKKIKFMQSGGTSMYSPSTFSMYSYNLPSTSSSNESGNLSRFLTNTSRPLNQNSNERTLGEGLDLVGNAISLPRIIKIEDTPERQAHRARIQKRIDKEWGNASTTTGSKGTARGRTRSATRGGSRIRTTAAVTPSISGNYFNSAYAGLVPDEFKSKDDVTRIQQEMINAGFDLGSTGADGIWGAKTDTAYKKYQAQRAMKEATGQQATQTPQQQVGQEIGYNPQFDYSQGAKALGGLGIRDYAGMVNFVKANPNHPLAQDLLARFGAVNEWDKAKVEGTLGIRGRYGRGIFGGGDLSDMYRNMAAWAGTRRAEYDRDNRYHWDIDTNGNFVQVPGSAPTGYGVGKVTDTIYYNGNPQTIPTENINEGTIQAIPQKQSTESINEGFYANYFNNLMNNQNASQLGQQLFTLFNSSQV